MNKAGNVVSLAQTRQADSEDCQAELDRFIYHITHDLRASVRALRELPDWIADDLDEIDADLPGDVVDCLAMIKRHSNRLDRCILDLLTYSRIGRLQAFEALDLDEALTAAISNVDLGSGFRLLRDLEVRRLHFGRQDIERLLTALISNAAKHHFADTGVIEIAAKAVAGDVHISVTDDGPGIAPEYQEKVFEFMSTLRPRDQVEGSGMGLPTARKICQVYGGEMVLRSLPDQKGCTFTAILPLGDSRERLDGGGTGNAGLSLKDPS